MEQTSKKIVKKENILNKLQQLGSIQFSAKWICIFIILFAIAIWFVNYNLHFNGFIINDSHDYAQLAKNVYNGNGYSTSVLRPVVYQFFKTLPQPEVTRMPVYPYLLGLFFKIFGANDLAIILFNGIFYTALVLLVYLLTYELSKNIFISIIPSIVTALMPAFLSHSLLAEPNILYAALYVAFFYFYLKYPNKIIILGLFLGLLYLVRANTQFVFIAMSLVYIMNNSKKMNERIITVVKFSAGFLVGIAPHLIRNYVVIGNPFFSLYGYSLLLFTNSFPAYTVWTQINSINPVAFAITHPTEIAVKCYGFFLNLLSNSIKFYNPIFLLLIGITFFIRNTNINCRILKTITIVAMITQTILVLPFGAVPYYYLFFFPIIFTVCTINVLEYSKKYYKTFLFCGVCVFLLTTISYWQTLKPANPFIPIGSELEKLTEKNAIIITDIPWELAWYGNRKSIWLPYDLDTLKKISETLRPDYVVLSQGILYPYTPYKDRIWTRMFSDIEYAEKLGYKLKNAIFLNGMPFVIIFKTEIDI